MLYLLVVLRVYLSGPLSSTGSNKELQLLIIIGVELQGNLSNYFTIRP